MATQGELQNRIDHLENILRERDRKEAAAKAAAIEAANATQDAKSLAARSEAATAEIETVRRGAWVSHLIKTGDQTEAVSFVALAAKIPPDLWPPGKSASDYSFSGGTVAPADIIDVATTYMGKALQSMAALAPIKP
jgi:hypothetical protein